MQQMSLAQKVTKSKMDSLKKDVEAKMYGVEAKINGLKKGIEAKMDDLKKGVEAKMNDVEAKMDDLKIDLKIYLKTTTKDLETSMEDLKTDLIKFLQQMLTNNERVVKETHDENKINVNHDFIDSNVGSKNHHVPEIDMRNFDGKDPKTWILQIEQFFDLHNAQNTQNVCIATLYLEPNQFIWYRWLCSCCSIDLLDL